ncbi:glycerol-3-phosphate dehydrogenase [Clostridium saccharobutylicum]|uniref:Glycerol-3-phosphate dehydrogenase n=1 Tax=Clostridium saccharobutylicum DSM 13864 TaxID=1345695 RepID=U5MQK2_CLOSA|nr:glycerol-3-phosphate dehydrogenase [Clostridium saccharobutylicum]AGX42803.1 glycerol-3-phosphate dehydrogenase [Clostridium saccharobutylicum DSM 13864]AQR90100.1 glycerol-3-phosphate dehydrogenase [Clostridium saccharobutylicum]AQS00006.1 glycerol-3-phosphate dehydrogenase [Clostridium saccharobutylicum]AQS09791.1 glycerol-3-phosphate dehydrogenase [Clostridium saccharobutylicum]AQS13989.1 glycerol-3-phosphate dehydrogenase [Clostridium saccharobutylicum]
MSIITIIGAGQMASALSFPATGNNNKVRLVGTPLDRNIIDTAKDTGFHSTLKRQLPKTGIEYYQIEDVNKALDGADVAICGVSSFGVDWFADNILPIIPEDIPLLSITKGMITKEDGEMINYPQYFLSKLPCNKKLSINAVGGPCTSYELADKDNSEVVFCGEDINILRNLKSLFETSYYHISLSTDIVGVECAVALKNAYALGVSLAIGLAIGPDGSGKEHYNSQAALFGQSIKEAKHILKLVGAGEENIIYFGGDLYVTVFGGRTRRIGTLLGQGFSFDEAMEQLKGVTLESIIIASRAAKHIRSLAYKGIVKLSDFPMIIHIDDIINSGASVDIPWKAFESEKI